MADRGQENIEAYQCHLKDIDRNPFSGIGKPEPLKEDKQGYWSRRIDEANRIVYRVERGQVVIVQRGKHYND